MDALVVASVGVVGIAVGAVLDPVGQQLADRSRDTEARRRAERDERRAAAAASAPGAVPEAGSGPTAVDAADASATPRPVPDLSAAAPTDQTPTDQTPTDQTPTDQTPTDQTPTDQTPTGQTPTDETVADETVADATPTRGSEPVAHAVGMSDSGDAVRHLLSSGTSPARTVGAALVTGALFALAASRYTGTGRFEAPWVVAPLCVFLAMAVVVSVTDLTHRLVPRQLLYGALTLIVPLYVILSAHSHHWRPLVDAAVAGAAAFALFFVIWFVVPRGMGFGDVRLAGVIGVSVGYLDLLHAYLAFLVGFVAGLVFGLVLMVGSSSGRKTRIPFAPALCLGAVVAILWGDPLIHHIFHAQA